MSGVNMDNAEEVRDLVASKFSQGLSPKDFFMKWSLGSGSIKLPQFNAGLRSLGINPSAGTQQLFKSIDADSSGGVSLQELARLLQDGPLTTRSSSAGASQTLQQTIKMATPKTPIRTRSGHEYDSGPGPTPVAPHARPTTGNTPPMSRRGAPNGNGGYPSGLGSPGGYAAPPGNTSPLFTPSSPGAGNSGRMSQRATQPLERVQPLHERKDLDVFDVQHHVLDGFRKVVLHRAGAGGINQLGRTFRIMDRDHNDIVTKQELKIGLQRFGMVLEEKDCELIMTALDRDNSGKCTYGEFLVALRGKLSWRRQQLIDMAFQILDKTGDGVITVDDLQCYNAKFDPDVQSGKISYHEALGHLLSNFDGIDQDGIVTKAEFTDYYRNLSASIDLDDYFELMMRNAWHIPGGEGWSANTSNTRVLVTLADGEQTIVAIEKDLGLDVKNRNAVLKALRAQGVKNVVDYHTCA